MVGLWDSNITAFDRVRKMKCCRVLESILPTVSPTQMPTTDDPSECPTVSPTTSIPSMSPTTDDPTLYSLSGYELERVPGDLVHHGQLLALGISYNPSSSLFIPLMPRFYLRVRPGSQIVRNQIVAECLHSVFCDLEQLLIPVWRQQERKGDVFLKTWCLLMFHCLQQRIHLP